MAKKRKERIQNPEPFIPDGTEYAKSKKSSKAPKRHQKEGELIDSHISSKIIKEAKLQLREVEEEDEAEDVTRSSFRGVEETPNVPIVGEDDVDGDIDDFSGFDENQSHVDGEAAVSHFFLFLFIFLDKFVLSLYESLVFLASMRK